MTNIVLRCFISLVFLFSLFGCTKDPLSPDNEVPVVQQDSGNFVALINGIKWRSNVHEAVYYPLWHQLYITATDNLNHYFLSVGINIDSVTALKNYLLESNGDNAAEIDSTLQYNSDHNLADAGGHFLLTRFDTTEKKISGNLQFTSYSADRSSKLVFSTDTLTNIPLSIVNDVYDGSSASCTVIGAKTTSWQSKNFFAKVTCSTITSTGITDKTLELHIESIIGGYPNHRYLKLNLPLDNPPGIYPVYANLPPYFYCGTRKISARYCVNNYDDSYYATSGTINITYLDTALRKLNANFNITFQDTTSRQETLQMVNGQFKLNHWEE